MLGGQVGLVIKAQGGGGFRVWLVFGGSIGLPYITKNLPLQQA